MNTFPSLCSFGADDRYERLNGTTFALSYTDATHLEPDDWRNLAEIDVETAAQEGSEAERSFRLRLALDEKFTNNADKKKRQLHVLTDALSLSATRLGLLSPLVSGSAIEQLLELKKSKGIVLLPDTNSIYNGTLHWLLRVLRDRTLWILPFVMSLTQMQSREAALKAMARSKKESNLGQALRSRAFVNAGLGLLERNHHRYQVLELDPSLLRYMKMPDKNGFDSDDSEVLEDRLLIEGVHAVLRSTRTRATQVVVTSDVLLSRVLSAEGITNLCLPTPLLSGSDVPNVRYDAWAQAYVGTTLRGLLWDLTHTFGSTRLSVGKIERVRLSCYWAGKLPSHWREEKLDVIWPPEKVRDAKTPSPDGGQKSPNPATAAPPASGTSGTVGEQSGASKLTQALSDAAVPQASLPLVLRMAGTVYATGAGSVDELLFRMDAQSPAKGNATRALEVLRRAKLIDYDGLRVLPRAELDAVESKLRDGDLDAVSEQFKNYDAYKVVLDLLRADTELTRDAIRSLLESKFDAPVANDASIRLVRYHILLGQAWTDEGRWRDGSNRPSQQEYFEVFSQTFDEVAVDNIATISHFLPKFCRVTRMSPWAAAKAAQIYAKPLSAAYSLQYAAGGKPAGTDQVLTGSLLDLNETVVPTDRIEIGGRPVLTLGRAK